MHHLIINSGGNNIYIYLDWLCIIINVGHSSKPEKIRSWFNKLTNVGTHIPYLLPYSLHMEATFFQVFLAQHLSFSFTSSTKPAFLSSVLCSWMITSVGYQLFYVTTLFVYDFSLCKLTKKMHSLLNEPNFYLKM